MRKIKSVALVALSAILVATAVPVAAFAEETPEGVLDAVAETAYDPFEVDKGLSYTEADDIQPMASDITTMALEPMNLSEAMRYFAEFESGSSYNQTGGDYFNAFGFYQFDRRYALRPFMEQCYQYDPQRYSMFAWVASDPNDWTTKVNPFRDASTGQPTALGQRVRDSWNQAYASHAENFSRLQDGYAYQNYYLVARNYLVNRGLNIDDRSDSVKGLVWSLCNLFGSGDFRKYVGGVQNGVTYPGAGLTNDMTDMAFVKTLCNYVINNVHRLNPGANADAYQRRYRNELNACKSYLYAPDINVNDWYATSGAIDFVMETGVMGGYDNGYFGPMNNITRGEVATILYRYSNPTTTDTRNPSDYAQSSGFADVAGGVFYTAAINWCRDTGVITGYEDYPGSGTYANFGPNDPVTREQLATMIYRYSVSQRDASTAGVSDARLKTLVGYENSSDFAQEGLIWCTSQGVLTGYEQADGSFRLDAYNNAVRASVAKMLMEASGFYRR